MGCKSNQLEGALIEENLINNSLTKADKIADADIFILNSCTVTHKSDNEAFQIINHVKKQNPKIKTVLTGCIAQIEKEKLLENSNIDIVLGNDDKLDLYKHLSESFSVKDVMSLNQFNQVLLNDTSKTRASLKIQDGCDNRCSYCIIPFARGKSRSADVDFILDQINIYEQAGYREIVLTGIHIGQWGVGVNAGANEKGLLHLLENIEEKTNISRFRLGSLNPLEINDEMLNFLKNSEKFCPHFHLSIQSMCDKTLKSMNRHYSVNQTLELIEKIQKTFCNIYPPFIGSDIIAGFAGETIEDFETTVENLKKSKLAQIHTFPYSVRKGTAAEKFEMHIDTREKNRRAAIIKEISSQKYLDFLNRNIGTVHEVLIEKNPDKKTGMYKGVTRNYINVFINPTVPFDDIKRTMQRVKLLEIKEKQILGEIF